MVDGMKAGTGNYGFDASRCEVRGSRRSRNHRSDETGTDYAQKRGSAARVLLLAEATLTDLPEDKKKTVAAHDSFE